MLIAYIHGIAYSVAEMTDCGVEVFSSTPEEGFIEQAPHVYTRFVAHTHLDGVFDETTYCTFCQKKYRIIGEDDTYYYLILEFNTGEITRALKINVSQIYIDKKIIYKKQQIIS